MNEDKILLHLGLIMAALATITKSEATRDLLLKRVEEIHYEVEGNMATDKLRWWQR